jgi:hypothetical protein
MLADDVVVFAGVAVMGLAGCEALRWSRAWPQTALSSLRHCG